LLLYGANGLLGSTIARAMASAGLRPILAGRSGASVWPIAAELGLEHRAFDLGDQTTTRSALGGVRVVLNCAGPFIRTYRPLAEACMATGSHYLDLTGEPPVYEGLASLDTDARRAGSMLLPGVGFDVSATDCLALHLKQRLPTATELVLAFEVRGPAALPPGTANTFVEMAPYGLTLRRRDGRIEAAPRYGGSRVIDFGDGAVRVERLTWGDYVMAYHSTAIPNIETYVNFGARVMPLIALAKWTNAMFRVRAVRSLARRMIPTGPTAAQRARTSTNVWGEVRDVDGHRAAARLHGPEAGVEWTSRAAVAAARRALAGDVRPGFQTPARAYGPDFVLEIDGVSREDVNLT
ncbi:MAG TPA: saccharopine dehydrogenase NADP-binding domain-containing protein, partial [Candidatus Limnocylindria bacterium]|nr:saccharopine dehydrogenase NADP-binding domain-containing protein [Candidatus Limnocylindria bacterium]